MGVQVGVIRIERVNLSRPDAGGSILLSSTEEQTIARRSLDDNQGDNELVVWAHDALQRLFTRPESDIHQMALSMEIEVSRDSFVDNKGVVEPFPVYGDQHGSHFLSEKDRQYIRALVVMGYREDAAILVNKAYDSRCSEIGTVNSSHGRLFSLFDVEYLEMLVLVGQRKRAVEVILSLMNEYELTTLGRVVQSLETQSKLETEYRDILESIDTTGHLPPEAVQVPVMEPPRDGLLRRAIRALLRKRA
jgi:hypothetical protein